MMVLRLMAFGRCSRGTSIGMSACRAGRSNAPTADPRPARKYNGHSVASPRKVSSASTSDTSAAAGAAGAVAEIRRNDQGARAADLHAGDALIPAANHVTGAEFEGERLAVV